ncbi:MAG TPA: LemA family protein [Candidatus Poseidoniales archaeon]|nr:MAG TPA: LemA family protein [Candidatus Poseidoniales archaeon]|tara:strand:- start:299 stop:907 length:609 start_codon:yes stop_codon:yes gene_type:complete
MSAGNIMAEAAMGIGLLGLLGCSGLLVLVLLFWAIGLYNRIIRAENECDRMWSNVDVVLQQRYDQFTSLVETIRGYAKHEKEMFDQFAEARMAAAGASKGGDIGGVMKNEALLGQMLPKIYAVAEQYPDLKANENFLQLQNEISDMENIISDRREAYNAAATNFNNLIEVFPNVIVANWMGKGELELYVVDMAARQRPSLEF